MDTFKAKACLLMRRAQGLILSHPMKWNIN